MELGAGIRFIKRYAENPRTFVEGPKLAVSSDFPCLIAVVPVSPIPV